MLIYDITRKTDNRQRATATVADIAVVSYLVWGAVNSIVVAHGHYDPLLPWKWVVMGVIYMLLRMFAERAVTTQAGKLTAGNVTIWVLVATGIIQTVIAALQWAGLAANNHSMFGVTGSFGNPGQLGGFLAVAFVVATSLFFSTRQAGAHSRGNGWLAPRGVASGSALIIAAGVLLADSRAAALAVAVGMLVYFCGSIGRWLHRRWVVAFSVTVVVLLIAGVVLYRYRPASSDARLLVWRVSADMIADKPLFGHGVGSFTQEYMPYQARYFEARPGSRFAAVADNVAYPYNELLHVLIEQGIVGALILVTLFVAIFARRPRDGTQQTVQAGLAALIAFSMFSYPADKFALLVLFAVFAGLAESRPLFSVHLHWRIKWGMAVILVAAGVFGAREYTFSREAQRQAKALFRKKNAEAKAFIDANYDRLKYSRPFNRIYAAWLAEHPDLERMRDLPPSCETYCDIGTAYAARGNYTETERYYTTAALMIPTRLMPNYLLWKMELQHGDTLRAVEIGEKLLAQPLKVENTFTLRAKAEVRELLLQFADHMTELSGSTHNAYVDPKPTHGEHAHN